MHAELALALVGFASVVGSLVRPLTPSSRTCFPVVLPISLRQVRGAVVPIWLLGFVASGESVWRIACASTSVVELAILVNAVGFPFGATFGRYHFALLLGPVSGFLLFADALVGPSSSL